MQEFVNRLIRCGYPPHDAYSTCRNFMKEYSIRELEEFISSLERSLYVG